MCHWSALEVIFYNEMRYVLLTYLLAYFCVTPIVIVVDHILTGSIYATVRHYS